MKRFPSINQLTALPSELFGEPPENRHHVKSIAVKYWEIQLVLDKAESALRDWAASAAVQALPEYIETAHDDGKQGAYTVDGYGRIEVDEDGNLSMVSQAQAELEAICQSEGL